MGFRVSATGAGDFGLLIRSIAALIASVSLSACAVSTPKTGASSALSLASEPASGAMPASATPVEITAMPVSAKPIVAAEPVVAVKRPALSSLGDLSLERDKAVKKVGKPYKVAGLWYVPRHQPDYNETGTASWYGPKFHGKATANGEIYNQTRLTAAHPTLPLPSYVEVTNLANGRSLIVRVNDRGPYKRGRILDLSARAAQLLGYQSNGTAHVNVRYVGKAPLNADDRYEQEFLAEQAWYQGLPTASATTVAEIDFTASIDLGDPAPAVGEDDLAAEVEPEATLRAPALVALGPAVTAPKERRVASSK
jgi:rare lipoprotein A